MADSDSQLDLKKRARRRLVGSAALALTAAIVLPNMLTVGAVDQAGEDRAAHRPGPEDGDAGEKAAHGASVVLET